MDNVKDIVKKDVLHIAEEQRLFLYNKFEKITMAIYLVTDIFPKEEPLKFCLRDKCLELLSFIMSLRDGSRENEIRITFVASEILSLLKVSASVQLVSDMNYKILINEYSKFLKLIKNQNGEESLIFEKDFFKEDFEICKEQIQINKGQFSKGQIGLSNRNVLKKNIKDNIAERPFVKIKKRGAFKQEKKDRKDVILKFIKDNKEVSVKDISRVVKNYSEKTIQRELVTLLNEGVLKKEGERRWSRYSINNDK